MVRITSLKRGARPKLDRTSQAGYSGERVISRPITSTPQLMALASAALEEPQGTLYLSVCGLVSFQEQVPKRIVFERDSIACSKYDNYSRFNH